MNKHYPFVLPSLPYRYCALGPYLEKQTIRVHHDTFFQRYADRLGVALQKYPHFQRWNLERLIVDNDRLPAEIRTTAYNSAGGVYNHDVYSVAVTPKYRRPSSYMRNVLEESSGPFENFKEQILNAGLCVSGSGWVWLVQDRGTKLRTVTTENQDTPLLQGFVPLLPLDARGHFYSLQCYGERTVCVKNQFALIDWSYMEGRCLNEHSQRPARVFSVSGEIGILVSGSIRKADLA